MTQQIGFVSTYVPSRCGIATFTHDLATAINQDLQYQTQIIAIQNHSLLSNYDNKVSFVINDEDPSSYFEAAKYVNDSKIKWISLQHEFHLYSGEMGEYIMEFVNNVTPPLITTLHTIPQNPEKKRMRIIQEISRKSYTIVVMINKAQEILKEVYGVNNVSVIPHGIHPVEFIPSSKADKRLGDETIISSSGLISSRKCLEYIIEALPAIIRKHPKVIFVIIGQTDQLTLKRKGEKYREKLKALAGNLGVREHVRFYNKYLPLDELIKCFQATDIYVTPYSYEEQISSGTLTYALGCGRVCISTPYYYAKELLGGGRGILVNFNDSANIAKNVNYVLDHPDLKAEIERKAYEYTRSMRWSRVGKMYTNLFECRG